ncbi:MAG: FAD-dependent oxidoreductase, partial [Chloroflexi bacterium]|nr:FAD-dependent oxidoreductase [Chloroflexota bacterium]
MGSGQGRRFTWGGLWCMRETRTWVVEPARQIEVLDSADVIVAGGGVSGCAAALAAARTGARTLLLERNGTLGGVATAGLMANIGNLFMDRDGRMVISGIPREVIDRLVARRAASAAWASREVPGIVIDSEQLKIVLIEALQEAGVQVLTHALAARPLMDGQWVRGVYVESKVGRQVVRAKAVVDATGEADLAAQTGCPMRWTEGSASLEFKMGPVDLDALYQQFRRNPSTFPVGMDMVKGFAEFERNWVERGIFFFPHGGGTRWDILQDAVASGEFSTERGILWRLDAAGLYGLRGHGTVIVNSN